MNIKLSNRGNTLVATLNGELDHHTAEYIRQKLDAEMLKSTTQNMVLDFSKVTFMDSSGIGVVMGRYKNIQKLNGKMALAGVNDKIKRIFEMSGLMKLISAYDSIDEAINKM
ncbi:MAG TPA: anti-sigma F factor antagonist [Acetivibrio sp.]|uniref:anti-sigma F factor antagonist n=1 Tax=Acetivibrio sp. TaxID=1872092 RepID=UPI002D11BF92|nr:anti-sigma F factor antagonist [Acetivibrio sp.]HOM01646.1 anti-sigma F factor antagonist [Acetivibrio sp.]